MRPWGGWGRARPWASTGHGCPARAGTVGPVGSVLVLWDVDHTLVNAGGASPEIYRAVFRAMFGRELPTVAPMAGRTDRAITADTLRLAGVDEPSAHIDAFLAGLAAQAAVLRQMVHQRGRVMPGAAAALAALADGTPAVQSVLTGNIRPLAEAKLAALGLTAHLDLDVGAYGDHHEDRAELVHLARRQAHRAYGEDFAGTATVLVGDTPLDVAAALAADARAIGVATGGSSPADLAEAGAHAVLPDLTDTASVIAAVIGGNGR